MKWPQLKTGCLPVTAFRRIVPVRIGTVAGETAHSFHRAAIIKRIKPMWAEPYNPLYVWGSCFYQIRTLFIQGGASVQQGLSAPFGFVAHDWHRFAADKRYSLAA
jgi:hypothetical protein